MQSFKTTLPLTFLSFLLSIAIVACGSEKDVFKKLNVELFPPVSGKLTNNGKPLVGVMLKRSYEFIGITDGEVHDYTTTDSEGRFSFPELTMQSRYADNPFRTNVIWQGIRLDSDTPSQTEEDEVYLWDANSHGVKHVSYFTEMLSELNCDVANAEEVIDVYDTNFPGGVVNFPIVSICRWPERSEIEKKKAADIEEYGDFQELEKYGNINGLI